MCILTRICVFLRSVCDKLKEFSFQVPEATLWKADKDFEQQCKVIPEKLEQLLQTLGHEDINFLQDDEEEVIVSLSNRPHLGTFFMKLY